jgi:hypothetical protein
MGLQPIAAAQGAVSLAAKLHWGVEGLMSGVAAAGPGAELGLLCSGVNEDWWVGSRGVHTWGHEAVCQQQM